MLEKNVAKCVRDAVKTSLGIEITWEEAFRMQPIAQSPRAPAPTTMALQKGDLTILAKVEINEVLGIVKITDVKSCEW